MKKISFIAILALFTMMFTACEQIFDDNTAGFKEGGLITSSKALINYVVGDGGTYSFDMLVHQNADFKVKEIMIYKSASIADASGTLQASNEILAETITVDGTTNTTLVSSDYAYADLIDGLTIDGNALPANDGDLSIGDQFIFRVVSVMENGEEFQQSFKVQMTVSTRYAGTYICTALQYWRISVASPAYWLGHELVIKSIDAITYEYDWGSTIGWDGPLYFQVDGNGVITYPAAWNGVAQTLNGQPLTTCTNNPTDLTNVPCTGTNMVIKDDTNGEDQLILTYGYYTAGSGPREFHETLVKKVD
jgi:hypothetical protein